MNTHTPSLIILAALAISACSGNTMKKDDEPVTDKDPAKVEQEAFLETYSVRDELDRRVVRMDIKGYRLMWDASAELSWSGTGFLLGPDLMVSNAHVLRHARAISAQTDSGQKIEVTHILAIDKARDLALARVTNTNIERSLSLLPKPNQAREELRLTKVVAAGYTAGGELDAISYYDGVVNNVVQLSDGEERIVHSANIAFGSSGGPLVNADDKVLLGINHAISQKFRFSLAVPSWEVDAFIRESANNRGRPIGEELDVSDLTTETRLERTTCLAAGDIATFPIAAVPNEDVLLSVTSTDKGQFLAGLSLDDNLVEREVVDESMLRAVTLTDTENEFTLVLVNHPELEKDEICLDITVKTIDWKTTMANVAY